MGIVHGDIYPRNLVIDPTTDDLQVFDFNQGAKLGWEGDVEHGHMFHYDPTLNDVRHVILTLYEIITRETVDREYEPEEENFWLVYDMKVIVKHPDVRLDSKVSKYRRVLKKWAKKRRQLDKKITHYTEASEYIDWPCVPEYPVVFFAGDMWRSQMQSRSELRRLGKNFLTW